MSNLPRPGEDYDGAWARQMSRDLEQTIAGITQPMGISYRAVSYNKKRVLNAGAGTTAAGEVGEVTVTIGGAASVSVTVTGVGGANNVSTVDVAQVLATLVSDMKSRGVLG